MPKKECWPSDMAVIVKAGRGARQSVAAAMSPAEELTARAHIFSPGNDVGSAAAQERRVPEVLARHHDNGAAANRTAEQAMRSAANGYPKGSPTRVMYEAQAAAHKIMGDAHEAAAAIVRDEHGRFAGGQR